MRPMNEQDVLDAFERLAAVQPDEQSSQRALQRVRETLAAPGLSNETRERPSAETPVRLRRRKMSWKQAKWMIPLATAAAILLAVGIWSGGHSRNGKPEAGAAYAFSDMPAVIGKARYLHLQGTRTVLAPTKQLEFPIDSWFDLTTGARRTKNTIGAYFISGPIVFSGAKQPVADTSQLLTQNTLRTTELVFDGQYEMLLDPEKQTATFSRFSPVKQRIEAASAGNSALQQLIGDPYRLSGFSLVSKENVNGIACEVWGNEDAAPADGTTTKRTYCWFAPQTGTVIKVQEWTRSSATKGEFVQSMLVDTIERDVVPPAGTFDTVPPAGYTCTNTKETAPLKDLQTAGPDLGTKSESSTQVRAGKDTPTTKLFVAPPPVKTYASFVLPDGSVILGMSSRSSGGTFQFAGARQLTPQETEELRKRLQKDGAAGAAPIVIKSQTADAGQSSGTIPPEIAEKLRQQGITVSPNSTAHFSPGGLDAIKPVVDTSPQDALFANLIPGGELPKLPTEVYGLKATNAPVTYTGRHLAWTKKNGECIEWALYVPDSTPPAKILGLHLLTRANTPGTPASSKVSGTSSYRSIVQPPVPANAGSFNDLVAAAMAELSDSGAAPEGMNLESVTQLAQQIRGSLGQR